MHSDQGKKLSRRADRAPDIGRPVPLPGVGAGARNGEHLAGRAHKESGGLMLAGDRADLSLQLLLELGIDEHEEAPIGGKRNSIRLGLPAREVAIRPVLKSRVGFMPSAEMPARDAALQLLL